MKYSDQLAEFSKCVLSLEHEKFPLSLKSESHKFKIYQRNYLQLTFNNFSRDFPATSKYVGEDNFLFLTREFLLNVGLKSPNIFQVSENFLFFLKNSFEIHQDEIIFELALLDLTWAYGKLSSIKISEGIFELWQELQTKKKSHKKINLNKLIELEVIKEDDEQFISLKKYCEI